LVNVFRLENNFSSINHFSRNDWIYFGLGNILFLESCFITCEIFGLSNVAGFIGSLRYRCSFICRFVFSIDYCVCNKIISVFGFGDVSRNVLWYNMCLVFILSFIYGFVYRSGNVFWCKYCFVSRNLKNILKIYFMLTKYNKKVNILKLNKNNISDWVQLNPLPSHGSKLMRVWNDHILIHFVQGYFIENHKNGCNFHLLRCKYNGYVVNLIEPVRTDLK